MKQTTLNGIIIIAIITLLMICSFLIRNQIDLWKVVQIQQEEINSQQKVIRSFFEVQNALANLTMLNTNAIRNIVNSR